MTVVTYTAIYRELASRIVARQNCLGQQRPETSSAGEKSGNDEWYRKHGQVIESIMNSAPGFLSLYLEEDKSDGYTKLVFTGSHDIFNENGWRIKNILFTATVTPSLINNFNVIIKGAFTSRYQQEKRDLEDILAEWLSLSVEIDTANNVSIVY